MPQRQRRLPAPWSELNDARIADPVRQLIREGMATGELDARDPSDAANAILGVALMAVLGRASSGQDPTADDFQRGLVEQVTRGVTHA